MFEPYEARCVCGGKGPVRSGIQPWAGVSRCSLICSDESDEPQQCFNPRSDRPQSTPSNAPFALHADALPECVSPFFPATAIGVRLHSLIVELVLCTPGPQESKDFRYATSQRHDIDHISTHVYMHDVTGPGGLLLAYQAARRYRRPTDTSPFHPSKLAPPSPVLHFDIASPSPPVQFRAAACEHFTWTSTALSSCNEVDGTHHYSHRIAAPAWDRGVSCTPDTWPWWVRAVPAVLGGMQTQSLT
jgi:hypothetical protein